MNTKQILIIVIFIASILLGYAQYTHPIRCENNKYSFVNEKDKRMVDCKYDFAEDNIGVNSFKVFIGELSEDGIPKKGFFGLVNMKGKEVSEIKYNLIEPIVDDLYIKDNLYKVFIGEVDNISYGFESDKQGKYGLINIKGEEVVPVIYDYIEIINTMNYKFVKVLLNGKVGYVNIKGEIIIPIKYDYIERSSSIFPILVFIGECVDMENYFKGKFGFVDINGEEVIPCKYEYAEPFIDNKAKVKLNNEDFYINTKGERIK